MIQITALLFRFLMMMPMAVPSVSLAETNQPQAMPITSEALTSALHKMAPTLKEDVLKLALHAYQKAQAEGKVKRHILTVIDYSLPSTKERMWVFDLDKKRLMFNTYVAHGKNSGNLYAKHFSNQNSSRTSSLGTYVTGDSYFGSKGYSLNLKGLEKGFNDHAYARRIVIHGAWYMEKPFIINTGRAGRSWGCPAVAKALAKPLINTIKNGSVVFAFYPNKKWLHKSHYV